MNRENRKSYYCETTGKYSEGFKVDFDDMKKMISHGRKIDSLFDGIKNLVIATIYFLKPITLWIERISDWIESKITKNDPI
ncbi:hypothetical protein LCGC14_2596300 [marine sediment metagenome]|uniref:Uncharacterized protein n=1 Tax=marine sediment metagenome TaxID=412755 RepID=A0A0F9AY07_9ZZZZ